MRRIAQIARQEIHHEIRPAFEQPAAGQLGLRLAHGRERKQMALDVVGLVNVRLDERDAANLWVPAEHVQNRHSTASRSNLEEMSHNCVLASLSISEPAL